MVSVEVRMVSILESIWVRLFLIELISDDVECLTCVICSVSLSSSCCCWIWMLVWMSVILDSYLASTSFSWLIGIVVGCACSANLVSRLWITC